MEEIQFSSFIIKAAEFFFSDHEDLYPFFYYLGLVPAINPFLLREHFKNEISHEPILRLDIIDDWHVAGIRLASRM
jgi:hypothetical protein